MDYSQNIPGFTRSRTSLCKRCQCLLAERSPGVWSRVVREGGDLPVDQCTPNTPHEPEESTMATPWRDREGRLAGRIDQLLGWAKTGQEPESPAPAEYYTLKAENTDRLRDDILAVVRELGGLAGDAEQPSEAMAIRAARLLLTGKGILPPVHTAIGTPLRPLCGNPDGFGAGGAATLTLEITCQDCLDRHGFTEDQIAEWDRWTREGVPADQCIPAAEVIAEAGL